MSAKETWVRIKIPFHVKVDGEPNAENIAAAVKQWFADIQKQGVVLVFAGEKRDVVQVSL